MTYSGSLDETVPGQGEFARLGASRIRDLTLALKERLASVFQDPNADPLVFKPIPLSALKKSYVEFTYGAIGTTIGTGGSLVSSQANTSPAGSPVIVNWKTSTTPSADLAQTILFGWCDGVNVYWSFANRGANPVNLNGCTVAIRILLD